MSHNFFLTEILLYTSFIGLISVTSLESPPTTPEDKLILWCLLGGVIGSACSLHFYPKLDKYSCAAQIGVNFGISVSISPLAVDLISNATKYPVSLRLALPVSFILGIIGQSIIVYSLPLIIEFVGKLIKRNIDNLNDIVNPNIHNTDIHIADITKHIENKKHIEDNDDSISNHTGPM